MLLLIRHALVDACGRFLAGRTPGIHLNVEGVRQAQQLAASLRDIPIEAVYTSPRERAQETAMAMALPQRRTQVMAELDEVDFGEWSGLTFSELDRRDDWRLFNSARSLATIPGGESMVSVQARAMNCALTLAKAHGDAVIALVSHADVLRALVASVLGVGLDRMTFFDIDPASVSVLLPTGSGFSLSLLNASAGGILARHFAPEPACAPR
jgi:broad specificity phosphatase PhoE